ncbi:serine hydrolase [Mycobacterium cookii]|nr:serine hydrolase [Mycobacterium cookii]MCV7332816.1 serine hydrolase [Mycobacterium cookii]
MPHRTLQASIDDVVNAATDIDWAISIRDATGDALAGRNADRSMEIASVGKLLILVEVARQCDAGMLSGGELLARDPTLLIADSGLWQHLRIDELSVHDLCILVASVSDNVATNVLVKRIGLQRVRELGASLGLADTAVLDYVRHHRGPGDPATFSTGSASELSSLMSRISAKELVSQAVSVTVGDWLATGVDLSMVASAFGLDPLSHATSSGDFFLRNKTGSDPGIRADVGTVGHNGFRFSYAVIANWDTSDRSATGAALSGMSAMGKALREAIEHTVP